MEPSLNETGPGYGMIEFKVDLRWERSKRELSRAMDHREHRILFPGDSELVGTAASGFRTNPDAVNPESLFVASVSSCHMLTYLSLARKNSLGVYSYMDHAKAYLSKKKDGRYHIVKIKLSPRIEFEGVFSDQVRMLGIRLVHEASSDCIISNSIQSTIEIQPFILFSKI